MKMKRKKAYFSISAVAKMFSVHQQTVRLYEKEGLIAPKRSEGNTRLFSEEDIDRLEEIIYFTHQLGINLAGVEMILKLKKQIKKMQNEMNALFERTQDQLEKEQIISQEAIKASAKQLTKIKDEQVPRNRNTEQSQEFESNHKNNKQQEEQTVDIGNWDIEYED